MPPCSKPFVTTGVFCPKTHGLNVILGVVHSAHHTLIITEEEDGQGGEAVDGYEKLLLLEGIDRKSVV